MIGMGGVSELQLVAYTIDPSTGALSQVSGVGAPRDIDKSIQDGHRRASQLIASLGAVAAKQYGERGLVTRECRYLPNAPRRWLGESPPTRNKFLRACLPTTGSGRKWILGITQVGS